MTDGAHVFPVRVYWEDTDASGIVYHASYLRFAERARTEMLRLLGIGQAALMDGSGVAFAVRRCAIEYLAPARLDDALDVVSRVVELRGASLGMAQRVERDGKALAELDLRLACIDRQGRATRVPAAVRAAFEVE
ncbi:MAG TPA: tol-pal system-associated acyl-CoA thioesterase [Alphaproteobacteria bacterium]|nr:tol-pal system-associated acyl-CoA thioesterase [Alphaproteobacteria bacterium]